MRPDKKKVRHHDSRKKAAQAKQKSEQKDPQPKPKRVIESNWDVDKPDFPESSDEEGTVDDTSAFSTGLDFNYVVENSLTSDALLRTKAEQEWERESQTAFTTEYFSIDLAKLESAIACVPVYQQLGLSKENLSDDSVQRFDTEATAASKAFGVKEADVDEINNKILTALKLSSKSGPSIDASANSGESITQKKTK